MSHQLRLMSIVMAIIVAGLLIAGSPHSVPVQADAPAIVDTHSIVAHLDLSDEPSIGDPIDVTLTITPTIEFEDAVVTIDIPSPFTISGASPEGYSEDGGILSWSVALLEANTPYEYSAEVLSEDDLAQWIGAEVLVNGIKQGGAAVAVRMEESEDTVVSGTGDGVFFNARQQDVPDLLMDSPFAISLIWNPLTAAETTASVVVSATNMTESTQSYIGTLQLPEGWTLNSGSSPWSSGSILAGQTATTSFSVTTGSAPGSWKLMLVIDPSTGNNYVISDIGGYQDDGTAYYEGQSRQRPSSGGGSVVLSRPYPPAIALGPTSQHSSRITVVQNRPMRRNTSCTQGEALVTGAVTAAGYPAKELRLLMTWTSGTALDLAILRLDSSGEYSVCVPTAGDPKIFITVYSTDALGWGLESDWSVKVFTNKQLSEATKDCGTISGPSTLTCNFEIRNSRIPGAGRPRIYDPYPFRTAATLVHHTRLFLARSPRPAVQMRGSGYTPENWQVFVFLYSTGPGYSPPYSMFLDAGWQKGGIEGVYGSSNHEYGHHTEWHLHETGGLITEGWADYFSAAVHSFNFEGSGGTGDIPGLYGAPLENLESTLPVDRRTPDPLTNSVSVSTGLWDTWDAAATEDHSSHTLDDGVPNQFGDAWDILDTMSTGHPCDFYAQWQAGSHPFKDEVRVVLDHVGWDVCTDSTPAPTQTQIPTQTPTPTSTSTETPTPTNTPTSTNTPTTGPTITRTPTSTPCPINQC